MTHRIKCPTCGEYFMPASLAEVFAHEHNGLKVEDKIGVCVERVYTEDESRNIKRLRFDYADNTVDVLFRNEFEYRYFDVPESILSEFSNTDTPGAFLAQKIKGNFRYYAMNQD